MKRISHILRRLIEPSFYKTLPRRLMVHSGWYHNLFEDAFRIQEIPQHLDIINLGSNPAKFAFDYSGTGVKGFNLAVGPQTLTYDFRMLKNYHSFLDDNGAKIVLFGLCPLTMCKDRYTEHDGALSKGLRYYPILHRAMIDGFDENTYDTYILHPERLGLKAWAKAILRKRTDSLSIASNPLTEAEMDKAAMGMVDLWKHEFFLKNFDIDCLSQDVQDSLTYNSGTLDQIIGFCKERDIRPVAVVLPVSDSLNKYFNEEFKNHCMFSILESKDIKVLDYSEDRRFTANSNFQDELRMNLSGRRKFTSQVITDLKRVNYL